MIAALLALALEATPATASAPPASAPAPGAAAPARGAPAAPGRIDADEIHYSWATHKVRMLGKPYVTLTREGMVLTCLRLTGDTDAAGEVARAVCDGDVKMVRAPRVVTCDHATYDRDAGRVVCTGHPVLHDGATVARGEILTYDLVADEVHLERSVTATVPAEQLDRQRKALHPKRAAGAASPGPTPPPAGPASSAGSPGSAPPAGAAAPAAPASAAAAPPASPERP